MSIQFDVEKNVSIVSVDVSNTTPYSHKLYTGLVQKHKGQFLAFGQGKEIIKFTSENDLTAFLNDVGNNFSIKDIQVTK